MIKSKSIATNSIVVSFLNVSGQAAKFILFIIIAALFGASWKTDAFFLAISIPFFVFAPIFQSVHAVFIPIFSKWIGSNSDQIYNFLGSVIIYGLLFTTLIGIVFTIGIHFTINIFAPNLSIESQRLVVVFIGILTPLYLFQILFSVISALYNAKQIFWLPSISETLRYVFTFGILLILKPMVDIMSLPISFLLGMISSTVMILLWWNKYGEKIVFTIKPEPEVVSLLKIISPQIISMAALHFSVVISRFLASNLGEGKVTILDYANRLSGGLMEILTSGVMLVLLSDWSRLITQANYVEIGKKLVISLKLLLILIVPIIVIVIILREPIVIILLVRGAFNPDLIKFTAIAMSIYIIGIPFDTTARLLLRIYLIQNKTVAIMIFSLIRLCSVTIFSLFLIRWLGIVGLVTADLISLILFALFHFIFLDIKIKVHIKFPITLIAQILGASLVCGIIGIVMSANADNISIIKIIFLSSACVSGYIVTLYALKNKEIMKAIIYFRQLFKI